MKEKMKRTLAATLAGFMGLSFAACGTTNTGNGGNEGNGGNNLSGTYSYLAIDINPSIEFMVNGETVEDFDAKDWQEQHETQFKEGWFNLKEAWENDRQQDF